MTGEWLAYCAACPCPEIANVFNRARIPFHQVTGMLEDDPECWDEVARWIDAARVAHVMEHNRLGVMGHYYCGMLDIYSDLPSNAPLRRPHRDRRGRRAGRPAARGHRGESQARVAHFRRAFDVQPDCAPEELERAARTSVALDRLVEHHPRFAGLLLHGHRQPGERGRDQLDHPGQFTADRARRAGRRRIEVKNVQAMKILDTFGAGGSFTEYYAMD